MRWYGSLRRTGEIAFVRKRGRPAAEPTLTAYGAPGRSPETRIAVTVSKAVGGAVVRNRVRRRIRGALDGLTPVRSLRLVVVAKPAAAAAPYAELAADVARALARLGPPG